MEIKIKDTTVTLRMTFRAYIIFEEMTGRRFSLETVTDTLYYFYSVVMACAPDLNIDLKGFIAWLDENTDELTNFMKWLQEVETRNQSLRRKDDAPADEVKDDAKKKE
jgi:hypothetical protein